VLLTNATSFVSMIERRLHFDTLEIFLNCVNVEVLTLCQELVVRTSLKLVTLIEFVSVDNRFFDCFCVHLEK